MGISSTAVTCRSGKLKATEFKQGSTLLTSDLSVLSGEFSYVGRQLKKMFFHIVKTFEI